MEFSDFGDRFNTEIGIYKLMRDLGEAMSSPGEKSMLGGGNPAHIPEVQEQFRKHFQSLVNGEDFLRLTGNYDAPNGNKPFIHDLKNYINQQFGLKLSEKNIAITNSSQTSFFYLFNLFAGQRGDSKRKILFPIVPEYIGYDGVAIDPDSFSANKPKIVETSSHRFKYNIDFDSLSFEGAGAICISRPTNPTGNVITAEELALLNQKSKELNIPLIIDSAYGNPFPNLIFRDEAFAWESNQIVCLSLSKLGLPGVRTGIIIAAEEVIQKITCLNSVCCLSPNSIGPGICSELIRTGYLDQLRTKILKEYYQKKLDFVLGQVEKEFSGLPYSVHEPEGAMFIWLWFKGLPIKSSELYAKLLDQNVIVVSGHYFFPGFKEDWKHQYECLRITYSQDEDSVRNGIRKIRETVKGLYEK